MKKLLLVLSVCFLASCGSQPNSEMPNNSQAPVASYSGLTEEQSRALDDFMKKFEERLRADGGYPEEVIQEAKAKVMETELQKMR